MIVIWQANDFSFRCLKAAVYYELQLPDGSKAQFVVHCTGIAEVMSSNPVQAWIFFKLEFHNCLSYLYNCDDQS